MADNDESRTTIEPSPNFPGELADEDLLRRRLNRLGEECNSTDAIAAIITLSYLARINGLLYIEQFMDDIKDPLFRKIIQLVVDGVDPEIIKKAADNYISDAMRRKEAHFEVLKQGAVLIWEGFNPRIIAELLYPLIGAQPPNWTRSASLLADKSMAMGLSQTEIDLQLDNVIRGMKSDIKLKVGDFEKIIPFLDDTAMQMVMREWDGKELSTALKATTREVLAKIFRNMSVRSRQMLCDDIRGKGPSRATDIIEAKERLLKPIYRMAECGLIIINRG